MNYETLIIFIFPVVMIISSFKYKEKAKRDITDYDKKKIKPNEEIKKNWKFVNNYASDLLLKTGIILLVLNLILALKGNMSIDKITSIIFFQILIYVIIFIVVEKKLKKYQ